MAIQKIPNTLIADNAVTASKIANGTLTADDIAANSITAAKLSASTSPTFGGLTLKDDFGSGVALTLDRTENSIVDTLFYLGVTSSGSAANDRMWFGTSTTDLTITDDGTIGIGTDSPSTKLHIAGPTSSHTTLRIQSTSTGYDPTIVFSSPTNGSGIYLDDNDTNKLKFYTGYGKGVAGKEITIDNEAQLGIGTTSPLSKLDVAGNVRISDGVLEFDKPSVYGFRFLQNDAGNDLSIQQGDANNANYVTRLNIGSSGNITFPGQTTNFASPGFTHHTNGYLYLRGGTSGLRLDDDSSINTIQIADGSNGFIKFETGNGSERMRIDSSGNVGIGETSPGSQLHITSNTAGVNAILTVKNAQNNRESRIQLLDESNGGGLVLNYDNGGNEAYIKNNVNGALGIYLGGTGAANALDDYEEGTWTPTFVGATLSTATGSYTKIGNQVTVHFRVITTGGLPSSTTPVQVGGLPFTIGTNFGGVGGLYVGPSNVSSATGGGGTIVPYVTGGESFIRFLNVDTGTFGYTIMGELEVSANNVVTTIGTVTYQV